MIDSPNLVLGLALVLVSAVALVLVLRKLRAVPVRSLRSKLLGAVVPVGATGAYLALSFPPYSVTVIAAAAIIGVVIGIVLARPRGRALRPESHQRGISLLLWSIVYVLAAAAGLTTYGGVQAVAAVAVTAAAGLAFGNQVGVLLRPRASGGAGAGGGNAAATGVAPIMVTALVGLLLTMGTSIGTVLAAGNLPDPCVFMDVTIWPGTILENPGIERGGDASQPSCTALFAYDKDEAGFILVGQLTVIQFPTTAAAQLSVQNAGTLSGQKVDFGDGGIESIYVESSKQLYAAYFSVDNYVGWVKGQAYSQQRIDQARAAAGRLATLMETVIRAPIPTPTPVPTATPEPTPSPSPALPSVAPSPELTPAPPTAEPTPAEPSPSPTAPATPGQIDTTAIIAGMQALGTTFTLGGPTDPQLPENTIRGIGAALAVIVVGLFLARFGGQASGGGSARRVAVADSTTVAPHSDTSTEAVEIDTAAPDTEATEPAPGE